jgi:hypothetical protein
MAGISDNLEIFRELSRKQYKDLIESLDEKYCWKCPMRTNSSEAFCREVDSWVRLSVAFEMGIYDHLRERGIPSSCLEVLTAKMLEKKMKIGHSSPKYHKLIFVKVYEDMDLGVKSGDFLLVNENPRQIKRGEKILLPRSCPLSFQWLSSVSSIGKLPLKIFEVEKVFHKSGVKYIKTKENIELPSEYVFGTVLKIINEKNPIFNELNLNKV